MASQDKNSSPLTKDIFMPGIPPPVVSINQGTYEGSNLNHPDYPQPIQRWLNIPYAYPPIQDLRFRPPVPLPSIDLPPGKPKIILATEWGKYCPDSMHYDPGNANESERDCLNLNIFRPMDHFTHSTESITEKPLLPVVLYIHGGGFNCGNGRTGYMISSLVARAYTPIIGVTFNYRVGAFGFLMGTLAMAEGDRGGVNVGLKDQICVMQWVQKNIRAFGGDPDNVTLMGSSAGAHSIGHHLNNTAQTPLFHRAIIESGASTSRACFPYDYHMHEDQFREFVQTIGCQSIPPSELIQYLRGVPAETIHNASAKVFDNYTKYIRWPWQPVIDGSFIPEAPFSTLKSGNWHKGITILTGYNTNDGAMFIMPRSISTEKAFYEFWGALRPDFSTYDKMMLERAYPAPFPPTKEFHTKRLEESYSDYAYIAPVKLTAFFASDASRGKDEGGAYLYHFAVKKTPERGADHMDHATFVTGEKEITDFSETWAQISSIMLKFWVGFIASGNPNSGLERDLQRVLKWEKVAIDDEPRDQSLARMVFGEGNTEGWPDSSVPRAGKKGTVAQFVVGGETREDIDRRNFWWDRMGRF